jgi:hypothetical protein
MKKILTILLMLFPLMLSAQDVWVEGTEWVVTYSEGETSTQVLSDHATFDGTEYLVLKDRESGEPIGYVRSERGDTVVYARGIIDGEVTREFLLYDFDTFEPGTSFRYSVYEDDLDEIMLCSSEINSDNLTYYHDVIAEGDMLPCCCDVIFKVGCIGGPMDLFYGGFIIEFQEGEDVTSDNPKPKTRNVSHLVFRPKGCKGIMIVPTDIVPTLTSRPAISGAYNLQGLPVRPPCSGIVIVGGKKILFK